jgi:hypothetical protein
VGLAEGILMRVLQVMRMKDQISSTGMSIRDGLIAHGCRVEAIKPDNGELIKRFKNHDLVLCSKQAVMTDAIRRVRKKNPHTVVACWNVDPWRYAQWWGPRLRMFNACHIFFVVSEGDIPEIQRACPCTEVIHLQQAYDPKLYPQVRPRPQDWKRYGCDVFFAGVTAGKHARRTKFFKNIRDACRSRGIKLHLHGVGGGRPQVLYREHSLAVACAKICLGRQHSPDVYMRSVRDYKIQGAGGFLLTEASYGLSNLFTSGVHLVTYEGTANCIEMIEHWLPLEERRKEIAAAARAECLARHTYTHRMADLLEHVRRKREELG